GRDPREIPLVIESLRLWQDLNERVNAETGFRTSGILFAAETEADEARHEAWLEHARPYQLDSRRVGAAEMAALLPGAAQPFPGALYTASDGGAEPQKATPAIAAAARRHGVVLLANCAVRGIETAAGRVAAVMTERGRIACGAVALAAGAWSGLFCA